MTSSIGSHPERWQNLCHRGIFITTGWLKKKVSRARGSRKYGSFYTAVTSYHKILVEERKNTKVWKPTGIELKCEFLSTSMAQEKLPLEGNGCIYSWLWRLNKHGCDFFFFCFKMLLTKCMYPSVTCFHLILQL